MAKITRKAQQIFASDAGGSGVAEPGSTADGSTVFTTDPDVIQSAAFLEGLAAMIIAGSKRLPVYEEINAIYYTVTRQLAYLFQDGLPDWNADTVYYQFSIVRKTGTYELYGSLINDNENNALPAAVTDSNWTYLGNLSGIGSGITELTGAVVATGPGVVAATFGDIAANTVLSNATASSAPPTPVALSASQFIARGSSGNIGAGTLGNNLSFSGLALNAISVNLSSPTTVSGVAVDLTGIPAGVKRVILTLRNVSTSGTSFVCVQLGDAGGVENTGYSGSVLGGTDGSVLTVSTSTSSFLLEASSNGASTSRGGTVVFDLVDAATFTWAVHGSQGDSSVAEVYTFGGSKALSAALDRVRLTTVGGSDTFDAGSVAIAWEF